MRHKFHLIKNREQRLIFLNELLAPHTTERIPCLGGGELEPEIMGIAGTFSGGIYRPEIISDGKHRHTVARMIVRYPRNKVDYVPHLVVFGAPGMVVIAIVNDLWIIVEQWRPSLGRWAWELPRSFYGTLAGIEEPVDPVPALPDDEIAMRIVAREVGNRIRSAELLENRDLGNTSENAGLSCSNIRNRLVRIRMDPALFTKGLQGQDRFVRVHTWTDEQLRAEIGRRISDQHSLSALALMFLKK